MWDLLSIKTILIKGPASDREHFYGGILTITVKVINHKIAIF